MHPATPYVQMPKGIDRKKEFILSMAILYEDGIARLYQPINIKSGMVVGGYRMNYCFNMLADIFGASNLRFKTVPGFITSENRFIDRVEAAHVAFAAGQIKEKTPILFAEELY